MSSNTKSFTSNHYIVMIDDEIELATLFKTFLSKEGFDDKSFTDPLLDFEYYKDTFDNHSLIITDMRMQAMNGIELTKRIRELYKEIKIFLMTAFDISELESNSDYKAARIDNLIQKPIHFSDLRNMINNTLKNSI